MRLLLPALAVAGFVWPRRAPYAPFLLLVLLTGVSIEVAGFPDGTPARDAMVWIYRNIPILAFMRTTQKAAPLVAISISSFSTRCCRIHSASDILYIIRVIPLIVV